MSKTIENHYPPFVMSTEEAAKYLGISPASLRGLQARGEITPRKLLGAKKGFIREELERYALTRPEWEMKVWNPHENE
ncbi:helix-turn-helix domain-containing protein [Timonella senegalensis]|uniref:helix-turn-helix domain-containing protein n=1 Tax=Timonella senegalensis TaxID=1465825 RepID=UPI002FDDE938